MLSDSELLDVLLTDVNGILRGKRVPITHLKKLNPVSNTSMVLPRGTLFLDSFGFASEHVDYGVPDGDPDRPLLQVSDPVPVPWADKCTQVLTEIADENGHPWLMNPRRILQSIVNQYRPLGLQPVVAIELEFYLFRTEGPALQAAQQNQLPAFIGPQTYNLDQIGDAQVFLTAVEQACRLQQIPITVMTSEYGRGQYEINLQHSADVLSACDQALLLKRIVRNVAMQQGLMATFMAKPLADDSGSGMHIHVSMQDDNGDNIFHSTGEQLNSTLLQAIAGSISLMPACIALFAQNTNAYKRFVANSFVPIVADWGLDHRAVAVRVPFDRGENTRIEHRVAGADSNPCLTVSAVLAGMLHGMTNKLPLPEPTVGSITSVDALSLPLRFREAVNEFSNSALMLEYFPADFIKQYAALKFDEEARCHAEITDTDHKRFVRTF